MMMNNNQIACCLNNRRDSLQMITKVNNILHEFHMKWIDVWELIVPNSHEIQNAMWTFAGTCVLNTESLIYFYQ